MADDFVVVTDHPSLIDYVDALQKKNAECLSFYPRQVFEREQRAGRLFLALLNGAPCGYIYAGAQGPDVKLHQVCIQYDARRRLYGAGLVQVMEAYANEGRANTVTLRCGFDIDANEFWRALGYGTVAVHDGGIRRMRRINVWQKQLMPGLFEPIYVEPEKGKTNASVWAKHKETGIVTQFIRGKKMAQYRALILSKDSASTNSSEISSGLVVTDQPNGATGWIDNAVTPPGESVERVLVAYPTGLVETTQAHYVRLYPTNYPWWMPLPVAPDPTPQPQPDAVASTFADCETAMGMEYTTPPCACAEYYPGLPHHPDCPTRNADPTDAAP